MNSDDLQTIPRRGLMLVLSSPSGTGKTTLSRRLLEVEDNLEMSVSATTRTPRPGEVEGTDYFFMDEEQFQKTKDDGGFLEWAQVFDNFYGTPRTFVSDALVEGRDILFDIDWQGSAQLTQSMHGDIVTIFILPPSAEALEQRLRDRAQDPEEVVKRRMAGAKDEIKHYDEYDYIIINDDIDRSVEQLRAILKAERLRRVRRHGLVPFVTEIMDDLS